MADSISIPGSSSIPCATLKEVFKDFCGRRAAIIKALTEDVCDFYKLCDPEKDNLWLYANANGTWDVNFPNEEVSVHLPEPVLGIIFNRDGMGESEWLSWVAMHSDSWLMALAFYRGARFGFDMEARRRLFTMINSLPTILEVVSGAAEKHTDKKESTNRDEKSGKEDSDGEEHEIATCGLCGLREGYDEFWIMCDVCESWFHGECVKITPARAKHIKQYRCSGSTNRDEKSGKEDSDGEEHEIATCGLCGQREGCDEFWIMCDVCESWFHGECVKITPARAKHIKQYRCLGCSNKRARV